MQHQERKRKLTPLEEVRRQLREIMEDNERLRAENRDLRIENISLLDHFSVLEGKAGNGRI
jgi:regulator of replication initiation timing